jgi:hypothetical protein
MENSEKLQTLHLHKLRHLDLDAQCKDQQEVTLPLMTIKPHACRYHPLPW